MSAKNQPLPRFLQVVSSVLLLDCPCVDVSVCFLLVIGESGMQRKREREEEKVLQREREREREAFVLSHPSLICVNAFRNPRIRVSLLEIQSDLGHVFHCGDAHERDQGKGTEKG